MFEEPERPLKGFKKINCICSIKKSFQICKFLKLLPARDRGTCQSGQRSGIHL
jgi:hypothetical protein